MTSTAPADFAALTAKPTETGAGLVTLILSNNRCAIAACPSSYIPAVDNALRYPTETAHAIAKGFRPPDGQQDPNQPPDWDGWIRMLQKPKQSMHWLPAGLHPYAVNIAAQLQIPVTTIDTRVRPEPGFPEPVTWPDPWRPYQSKTVDLAVERGRGVIDIPPRGGKTRVGLEWVRRIALPTLWIAPTESIVTQTVERAVELFGKGYVHQQVGTNGWEDAGRRNLVICTAATASMLPGAFWKTRQAWVIDEFHHAAAKTYRDMERYAEHVYYRLGLTGTFFRSGDDELALHGILSETIAKITVEELLELGVLVPTNVVFVPIDCEKLRKGYSGVPFQSGVGRDGIYQHPMRNQVAAYAAQQLARVYNRRVLVLVATKKQGAELASMIRAGLPPAPHGCQFRTVELVTRDVDRDIQRKIKDSFVTGQEVRVLIGTSLIGEGVDLPNADALIYATGGKAEVSHTQNAYRVCTADTGKTNAVIIDFADRHHKTLMAHSASRLETYYGIPVFRIDALASSQDFPNWLSLRLSASKTP